MSSNHPTWLKLLQCPLGLESEECHMRTTQWGHNTAWTPLWFEPVKKKSHHMHWPSSREATSCSCWHCKTNWTAVPAVHLQDSEGEIWGHFLWGVFLTLFMSRRGSCPSNISIGWHSFHAWNPRMAWGIEEMSSKVWMQRALSGEGDISAFIWWTTPLTSWVSRLNKQDNISSGSGFLGG